MGTKTNQARVTLDGETEARVRKTFADATEAALAALGGESASTNADGAVNIHIHNGRAHVGDADSGNDDDDDEGKAKTGDGALLKALADGQVALMGAVSKIGDAVAKLAEGGGARTADADAIKTTDGMPDEVEAANKGAAGDSKALETSFAAVVADAEVLVPGFMYPTFDATKTRRITMDSMCALRRRVIDHLGMTADGTALLKTAAAGQDITKLGDATCFAVASIFRNAALAKKTGNNNRQTGDGALRMANPITAAYKAAGGTTMTVDELSEWNRKHYGVGTATA